MGDRVNREQAIRRSGERLRMEIVKKLELSPAEFDRMELHAFLNILHILLGELYLLRVDLKRPQALLQTFRLTETILGEVKDGRLDEEQALRLASVGFFFAREIREAFAAQPNPIDSEMLETADNIRSIVDVLTVRLQEHFERRRVGLNWVAHPIRQLTDRFMRFFAAVEKNSRGRYQILFNVAACGSHDYLINLTIEGANGRDYLLMPPVVQDVFRDLIANARKYTQPGGEINAGLLQDEKELRVVVEDNGCGIPADEVEKVVEFGYRGRAVRDKLTHGDGFGLTKAYVMTRRLGGRMWIESEPGRGTRVILRVPVPPAP